MSRPLRSTILLAAVLAAPAQGRARAAALPAPPPAEAPVALPPPAASPPRLVASGACPSSETVWSAITMLVPKRAIDALPSSAAIEVSDLGDDYRVTVTKNGAPRERTYRDTARDCEQRARFAAVFIVLTLMPPELLAELPASPAPPPPPAVVAAPAAPPSSPAPAPRLVRLELGAFWDVAPPVLSAPSMTGPGGELRVAIGRGRFAGVAGLGAQARASFTVDALEAREERVSFDVGVRGTRALGGLDLAGELSLAGAVFRAQGINTAAPQQQTRLDVGARAGLVLRLGSPRARIAPIVGAHATFFPKPYDIATTPQGILAETPSLWLGATVGLCASL
jgi:hypothetical protein